MAHSNSLLFQQEITPDDSLPKNLCSRCVKQLLACNSFQKLCMSSVDYLQDIVRQAESESTMAKEENDEKLLNDDCNGKDGPPTSLDIVLMNPDDDGSGELTDPDADMTMTLLQETDPNDIQVEYYVQKNECVGTIVFPEFDHDYYVETADIEIDTIDEYSKNGIEDDGLETDDGVVQSVVIEEVNIPVETVDSPLEMAEPEPEPISPPKPKRNRTAEQKKDLCIICGALHSHGNMRRHMETHMGSNRKQPYQCSQCDRKFINRPSFVAHVNKHNNQRPFKCTECEKSFYGANLLRTHMFSHSTENKYACTDCDKVFRYPHYLSQHRRIHRANTVYACDLCDYTNVYLHNYKNHLRKHTGEYRYRCEHCAKGFGRKLSYLRHLNKHVA